MRTIRVELQTELDAVSVVRVSTEVIVADEEDAHEAGREAARVMASFIDGYGGEPG